MSQESLIVCNLVARGKTLAEARAIAAAKKPPGDDLKVVSEDNPVVPEKTVSAPTDSGVPAEKAPGADTDPPSPTPPVDIPPVGAPPWAAKH